MRRFLNLLLLVLAATATAQDSDYVNPPRGFTATVHLGLGPIQDVTHPVPLAFALRNRSEVPLEGRWEMFVSTQSGGIRRYQGTFAAPGRSHKRYRMCLDLADAAAAKFRLVDGGTVWFEKDMPLSLNAGARALKVVTVTTRRAALKLPLAEVRQEPRPETQSGLPLPAELTSGSYPIEPWLLPDVEAAMHPAAAIFINSAVTAAELTESQLRSLGDYAFAGGVVVLPALAEDLQRQALAGLPNEPFARVRDAARAQLDQPGLQLLPVGAGLVGVYGSDPLAADAVGPVGEALLAALRERRTPGYPPLLKPIPARRPTPPQAVRSVWFVAILFAAYALLTGPLFLLFLRRAKRRTVALAVGIAIGLFCVLTMACGLVLRVRRGDLEWLTLTQLTPDGGIQYGLITLTSAGGHRHRLDLSGDRCAGWILRQGVQGTDWGYRYYPYGVNWSAVEVGNYRQGVPFTVLDSPPPASDSWTGDVPISPWGSRLVLARGLAPQLGALTVTPQRDADGVPVALSVRNDTGRELSSIRLIVGGVTRGTENSYRRRNANYPQHGMSTHAVLAVGETAALTVPAALTMPLDRLPAIRDVERKTVGLGHARAGLPAVECRGRLQAVIVARVAESPALAPKDGDFVRAGGEHWVFQVLDPELLEPFAAGRLNEFTEAELQAQEKED